MTPTSLRAAAAALALAAVVTLGGQAHADNEERARAHFEAGRVQYNLGDYKGAVREFAAGYQLVPRPQFLVNLGQAYRRLGQLERAREMYERFLADAPPADRARPQVRELVAEVERELARTRAARAIQPARSNDPSRSGEPSDEANLEPPSSRATPVAAGALTSAPAPSPSPSGFWRRNWWVVPVAAVAVAGLSVGIYFAARPSSGGPDCGAAELGCLDLKH